MNIWIVEHGQYSDRHVVAVTDDEALAERLAALGSSGTVSPYVLNEFANRLDQGFRRWLVTFLALTGDVLQTENDWNPCDLAVREPFVTSYPNPPSNGRKVLVCEVVARDKDEAIKIASERRREWLAVGAE